MSTRFWTRREVLTTLSMTAAAGLVIAHAGPAAAQSVKFSAGTEAPKLKAPANATDCHQTPRRALAAAEGASSAAARRAGRLTAGANGEWASSAFG